MAQVVLETMQWSHRSLICRFVSYENAASRLCAATRGSHAYRQATLLTVAGRVISEPPLLVLLHLRTLVWSRWLIVAFIEVAELVIT